jgi:acyl-coenzyme A thioesterase PaaI-like protein
VRLPRGKRRNPPRHKAELRDPLGTFEFEPHHCFACGDLNEHGLHLQLHTSPEGSWAEVTLDPKFQGWDAVAHGGIVCTILDEVMAWSVIGRGTWGVTARLNVAFRRPIPTGRPIRAEGWVLQQHRRANRTAGRLLDAATGEVLATSEGTFVALPSNDLERLKARYGLRRTGLSNASDGDTPGAVAPARASGRAKSGMGAGQ